MRFRSVAAILMTVLLAACSPDYNWREVTLADGLVVAIFPDKPREQTKTLPFAGHDIAFTLTGTVLDDTVFAVGYAPLPPEVGQNAEQRALMYQQIVQSFYANFGQTPPAVLPEPGTRFSIEGKGPKGPLRLEGVVWMHPGSVTEGLVTAPAGSFPQAQADEFLRAIKAPGD